MANVLVMIEFLDSEPLCASLEALGQARRLGSAVGMTVYALLPMQSVSPQIRERLGQILGHFGADGVVLLTAESPVNEQELRFAPYARALLQACEELPPKLFFMADTPAARDIAPRLAARIGGIYLASGEPVCEHGGLQLFDATGQLVSACDDPLADEMFAPTMVPVVMTLPAGRYALSRGSTAVPVRFMAPIDGDSGSERTPVPGGGFTEEGREALSRSQKLWLRSPVSISPDTVPPLSVIVDEKVCFDRRLVLTLIALGPASVDRSDAQFAVPIADGAVGDLVASVEAAFAKPKGVPAELNLASLMTFDRDDDEELTPSTGRAWEGSDLATGDTEPRLPAPGDAANFESAPVVRVAVGASSFERASAGDGAMWDGDLTPPPEDDAAPQAEMDGIDTEPIGEPGSGKEAHSDRKSAAAMDEPGQREEQP